MTDPLQRLLDTLAPEDAPWPDSHDDFDHPAADDWRQTYEAAAIDDADYCARRLRVEEIRAEQVRAAAQAERERIAQWELAELERIERPAAWYRDRLEHYHRQVLAENPKAKTVRLPCGTQLRSVAGKLHVEVADENALLAWLEEHEQAECIVYKPPVPNRSALAQRYGAKAPGPDEPGDAPLVDELTGEMLPGAQIVRGPRSFTVASGTD